MTRRSDVLIYCLAVLLGLAAGILEITLSDLLVTAIFVMFAAMGLGFIRAQRAWRWALIVALGVPLLRLSAHLFLNQYWDRAQIWESAFAPVIALVGAYAGVLGRLGVNELFRTEKANSPRRHGGTETRRS